MSTTIEYVLVGVLYVTGAFFSLRKELKSIAAQFIHFSQRHITRTFVRHDTNVFVLYGVGFLLSMAVWIMKTETHTHFSIQGSVVAFSLILGFGYLWGEFSFALCSVTPSTMEVKEWARIELQMEYKND